MKKNILILCVMVLHALGQGIAKQNDSLSVLDLQGMGCLGKEREDRHKEGDCVEDKKATANFRRLVRRISHIEGGLALVSLRVVFRLS